MNNKLVTAYENGAVIQRDFEQYEFHEAIKSAKAVEAARLVWRLDALKSGEFVLSIFADNVEEAIDDVE